MNIELTEKQLQALTEVLTELIEHADVMLTETGKGNVNLLLEVLVQEKQKIKNTIV